MAVTRTEGVGGGGRVSAPGAWIREGVLWVAGVAGVEPGDAIGATAVGIFMPGAALAIVAGAETAAAVAETAMDAGRERASCWAMVWLAEAVPSAPQMGQVTEPGGKVPVGSISKEYF